MLSEEHASKDKEFEQLNILESRLRYN